MTKIYLQSTKIEKKVWLSTDNGRVYKSQPKYMTDTELAFLNVLEKTGYVPGDVRQEGIELISMEYIEPEHVTNEKLFMAHLPLVIGVLRDRGIRHGDLTEYSVRVKDNRPILVDFSESRWMNDPAPDKRPEGDSYWLERTMRELCKKIPAVYTN